MVESDGRSLIVWDGTLEQKKREQILIGVLAVVGLAVFFLPDGSQDAPVSPVAPSPLASMDESSDSFGFDSFFAFILGEEPSPPVMPLPPVPDSALESSRQKPPPETDLTQAEVDSFLLAFESEVVNVKKLKPLLSRPVWEAMEEIETWYAAPEGVEQSRLYSYLHHRKLWVRLTALQFALGEGIIEDALLSEARRQIIQGERHSQVRRFLQRVAAVDPELHFEMLSFLGL